MNTIAVSSDYLSSEQIRATLRHACAVALGISPPIGSVQADRVAARVAAVYESLWSDIRCRECGDVGVVASGACPACGDVRRTEINQAIRFSPEQIETVRKLIAFYYATGAPLDESPDGGATEVASLATIVI